MLRSLNRSPRRKGPVRPGLYPASAALLNAALCVAILAGSAWSWFSDSQTASVSAIETADIYLDSVNVYEQAPELSPEDSPALTWKDAQPVNVTIGENNWTAVFSAAASTRYSLTLSLSGTAEQFYAKLTTPDGVYCLDSLPNLTLYLIPATAGEVTIEVFWGQPGEGMMPITEDGATLGTGALPECTCKTHCDEAAPNADCPFCVRYAACCTGSEEESAADAVCTCQHKCTPETETDCPVCAETPDACQGQPPEDPSESTDPTEGEETPTDPTEGEETPTDPSEGEETPTDPSEGEETPTDPTEGGETPSNPTEGGDPTNPSEGGDIPSGPSSPAEGGQTPPTDQAPAPETNPPQSAEGSVTQPPAPEPPAAPTQASEETPQPDPAP